MKSFAILAVLIILCAQKAPCQALQDDTTYVISPMACKISNSSLFDCVDSCYRCLSSHEDTWNPNSSFVKVSELPWASKVGSHSLELALAFQLSCTQNMWLSLGEMVDASNCFVKDDDQRMACYYYYDYRGVRFYFLLRKSTNKTIGDKLFSGCGNPEPMSLKSGILLPEESGNLESIESWDFFIKIDE